MTRSDAAMAETLSQARSREAERGRASELEDLVEKLGEAEASYRTLVVQLPAIVYTASSGRAGSGDTSVRGSSRSSASLLRSGWQTPISGSGSCILRTGI